MARTITKKTDAAKFGDTGTSKALLKQLEITGRMPPVTLLIKPIDGSPVIGLDRFLSYNFTSSILIPVDTFSFAFVAPDGPPLNEKIKEGDIVVLLANNVQIATGLIDTTDVETDGEFGEKSSVTGRDLMAQLEDQDAISLDSRPLWSNNISIRAALNKLIENTRIKQVDLENAPKIPYLLASQPGESKLATLQRFLEPLNCLAWMSPGGHIVIGKPNMTQASKGVLKLSKKERYSNVLHMKATRSSTGIPNVIVPIWSGQETVIDRVSKQQLLFNKAYGPNRLFKLEHRLPKSVVVSTPDANTPQGLAEINAIKLAGNANILQAYAKREMARQNQKELIVQAVVPGHFNEAGEPYVPNTCYDIVYDRGNVEERMYLFQCDYVLDESGGQKTNLYFCKLGTIVSDIVAP